MINKDRIVDEFITLVKIDSPSLHERKIADYLTDKLQKIGLKVTEDGAGKAIGNSCDEQTGNLIAVLDGNVPDAPTILLCAHMDTVEPGRGVKPVIKENAIYSDGKTVLGADNKAGIAAILEVLTVLKEKELPHGNLEILFTVAEEIGLVGSKNLDHKLLQADIGYVLDCDGRAGTIITRAPAQYRITASIIGRAAHAGISPEEGVNAIYVASKAISQMKLGRIDEETTANIGVISGGKATNIIPDLVNIEGETRSIDPEKLEKQTEVMLNTLRQAANDLGAEVEAKKELLYPRLKLEETDRPVQIAVNAARQAGQKPVLVGTGGGSDANIMNGLGIPTVNLGIGMNKVHSTEEFITIEDLVLNARYVLEIIKSAADQRWDVS